MPEEDLETRLLSGAGFEQPRSTSPTRSASTSSPLNTDDELGSDLSAPSSPGHADGNANMPARSGPQTGVKGVIKDAQHRKAVEREVHRMKIAETNAYLERKAFQAQTLDEEDDARKQLAEEPGDDLRRQWVRKRQAQLAGYDSDGEEDQPSNPTRFRLREIGEEGFVDEVERPGWVLVMLYEPDVPRCRPLLRANLFLNQRLTASRRRSLPTFLQARATSLSFSLLEPIPSTPGEDEEDGFARDRRSRRADPDVLPTLLAYKNGELEHTFVRVDWEVGADGAGLEDLLVRNGILQKLNTLEENHGDDVRDDDEA